MMMHVLQVFRAYSTLEEKAYNNILKDYADPKNIRDVDFKFGMDKEGTQGTLKQELERDKIGTQPSLPPAQTFSDYTRCG